jgi:hypothetical protein
VHQKYFAGQQQHGEQHDATVYGLSPCLQQESGCPPPPIRVFAMNVT